MPAKDEHVAIAKRNETTLDYLLADVSQHAEWVATVAFYTALHYIEECSLMRSKSRAAWLCRNSK